MASAIWGAVPMRDSPESSPPLTRPAGLAGPLGGVPGVTDGDAGLLRVVQLYLGVAGVAMALYWCTGTITRREKTMSRLLI